MGAEFSIRARELPLSQCGVERWRNWSCCDRSLFHELAYFSVLIQAGLTAQSGCHSEEMVNDQVPWVAL